MIRLSSLKGRRTGKADSIAATAKYLLVALLSIALPAAAEIYKCSDKSGLDRYQNFPCAIDAIGLQPSGPVAAKATSPANGASQVQPTPNPAASATVGRSDAATEPGVGMTEAEVRAIWGEPQEVIQDEPRDGRIEIWRYGEGRSVQFSNKHRVLLVDR
jgi:hypothetical protein